MLRSVISRNRVSKIAIELITALLVILWIYTSISKVFDYQNFKTQLGRSPFLEGLSGLISIALPLGELIIAVLLVIKRTRKVGLYLSFGTMLLFTGYIFIMLHYAYDLPCSCGGVLAQMSWNDHLWFNIGYTFISILGILIEEHIPQSGRLVSSHT